MHKGSKHSVSNQDLMTYSTFNMVDLEKKPNQLNRVLQ